MKTNNAIGLDANQAEELAKNLNELLANYQVFYMNVRGFHWNITGEKFFELHVKFEEIYTNIQLKIDEIAERILTLGYTPLHTYTQYLQTAKIAEAANVKTGKMAVENLLTSLKTIITLQRQILVVSGNSNDEGTNALMSDYIREQEKMVWMYGAYLK